MWRTKANNIVKVFFATDVHGSDLCFRKFVNAARFYGVDALILGGDIAGKSMVPIVNDKGRYRSSYLGQAVTLESVDELEKFERVVSDSGLYPFRTTTEEVVSLESDQAKREGMFLQLMKERLNRWIELAEERLKDTNVRLYFTGGNDDPEELISCALDTEHVIRAEGRHIELPAGHEMASCGYSNMTPWKCPRDLPEEELEARLEESVRDVQHCGAAVFNFHVPPINSTLDSCPQLDTTTWPPTPMMKNGEVVVYGAGSRAVRRVIEKYQPALALHGHIHESRGAVRIGRTVCINPGSEYTEGILRGVVIALARDGVEGYQLTAG
jgi:Icc-related predicted phosphoesterase